MENRKSLKTINLDPENKNYFDIGKENMGIIPFNYNEMERSWQLE